MEAMLIQLTLILITTKIAGLFARKLKMPEVLGMLLAGVLIGPIGFSVVHYTEFIKELSEIGVIMLMFLAGLETNLNDFKKVGIPSLIIAVAGIVVPFFFGMFSSRLFFKDITLNIFIDIILTPTSVSITVETLEEMGKLKTKTGVTILGASVIDDLLGLIILSVFLATTAGNSGIQQNNTSLSLTIIKFCFSACLQHWQLFFYRS